MKIGLDVEIFLFIWWNDIFISSVEYLQVLITTKMYRQIESKSNCDIFSRNLALAISFSILI